MDLLPLYHDGVCNESSKKVVEEHITECGKCKAMLEEMKDNKFEESIIMERENVLENHIKKIKKSLIQGLSVAMVITIVPTFVVNLVTSRTLNWFYLVLGGVLLFASLTIVPLHFEKHRGILTLISSTASVLLLLFVIDYYVGSYTWFMIAAIPVLLTAGCSWFIVNVLGKRKS